MVAEVDDAGDFGEGESGGLGVTDELEAVAVCFVVGAVSVCGSGWFGQEPACFVEADGSRRVT